MPAPQGSAEVSAPLSALAAAFPCRRAGAAGDPRVTSVQLDSRRVAPGALFAALPGAAHDGRAFLAEAIARGAAAALGPAPAPDACPIPYLETPAPRRAVALAASRLYDDPSEKLALFGVTGTSGKTTTSMLLDAALARRHPRRVLVGTVATRDADGVERPAGHTTPEATELTPFLAAAVARGAGAATMEASSHALAQDRLAGLRFDVAAFTNLSRDHLDYHRTFEEYFAAKARLFDLLKPGGRAVINADDSYGRRLIERLPPDVVLATSLDGRAACELSAEAEFGERGVVLRCRRASTGERFDIRSPLLGRPNAENLLTAAAAALAGGLAAKDVADALGAVSRVPGRLEPVPCGRGFSVLVDYAHKPAALEGVLKTVRALAARSGGRVLVVFGCGGDRDRGKRPEMGAIAARLADLVFVTSDNPRSEAPEAILADIRAGVEAARGAARYDVDRRAAVATALSEARPGDVVLIAGKGHETSQTIGGVSHPFDDRKVARELLAAAGDAVAAAAASGGAAPA